MLIFELPSCRLRPWRSNDVDGLVAHANDRDVWINLRDRFPHPYTHADAMHCWKLYWSCPLTRSSPSK